MKFKTTQKAIKESFATVICIPYCGLQSLLHCESPVAYTTRREGWAADIYDIGGGVAIVTGYAPFGNVRPSYEIRQEYEKKADEIRSNYNLKWEEQRDSLKKLLREFVEEVTQ